MFQKIISVVSLIFLVLVVSCTGSKKYFKAASKLEKQGLVKEAAEFYMESLQRKPKNTDARIKLKEVGQKHVSNMSSAFFREYNTQQFETSLTSYENLKTFVDKSAALSVTLDYPQSYADDYKNAVNYYLNKNYNEALDDVNQGRYDIALTKIKKIKKYDPTYKQTAELEITSTCEPLYQSAIKHIETKNYLLAQKDLQASNAVSEAYKDSKDLTELVNDMLRATFLLFQPKNSVEKDIEENLFNNFIEVSYKNINKAKLINNSPFLFMPEAGDIATAGNIDLIQAIRKATGADFFYVFDISNKKENASYPSKSTAICYEKVVTKKDTVFITDYVATKYNQIKAQASYSYDFKYKLIDAFSNQLVSSKKEICTGQDNIDYNEFVINKGQTLERFFPYNPLVTPQINQYNPSEWRRKFSNRKNLKQMSELKTEADNQAIKAFERTLNYFIVK